MNSKLDHLVSALGRNRLRTSEPLSRHTYFKIGGPADLFFTAQSLADLTAAVTLAIEAQVPYFILGGGSNILVGDRGIRGLVIKNRADAVRLVGFQGKITGQKAAVNQALVEAESGALLNKLSRRCIEEGLQGLEVFLSVPGTVGGALFNNSHYRPEKDEYIGNFLHSAQLINRQGQTVEVNRGYFNFAYDYSRLQDSHDTLLKATFSLAGAARDRLWQLAAKLIKRRNRRQPVGIACSGCTFRNISQADALRLATPQYTRSAGYLIDKAGLKNARVAAARVSPVHANFIENTGGATARQVIALIDKITAVVHQKFGVRLQPEIFKVGQFD